MKWIGQHIWDFISRFRSDVYLEDISDAGSDTDKFLVAESDGKISYRTGTEVLSDIGAVSATLTDEQVQDKVGAMFSGNTETGITATYQDSDGTIDLAIANGGRLKILHSDFIPDDGGRTYAIDDSGIGSEELFGESYGTSPSYATISIPYGFTATHVMIYGSATGSVEVWEHQINSKTGVSKGTGNVDTEIDIVDVASSSTNYLFIGVQQGSGDEIHGGYVTITAS